MSMTPCPPYFAADWRTVADGTPVFIPSTGDVIAWKN
jgi:hypothetical protein